MSEIGWMRKPLRFAVLGLIGALLGSLCGEALIRAAIPPSGTVTQGTAPRSSSPAPVGSDSLIGVQLPLPPPVELPREIRTRVDDSRGQSGEVEIALVWNNINDLDLHCVDPTGSHIFFAQSGSPSGGFLDIDQNRQAPFTREAIEHIRWNVAPADWRTLLGTYKVYIDHYAPHGGADPTDYTVYLKYPGQGTAKAKFQGRISYSPFRTQNTPLRIASLTPITSFTIEPPPPTPTPPPPPPPAPAPALSSKLFEALIGALWTLLVAVSLSLLLVAGQNRSTKRGWLSPQQAVLVVLGAGLTGLIAGGGPQLLYGALPDHPLVPQVGRVAGWAALGGVLGLGMSRFIPNLAARRAALAGLIGGAIGCLGYLIVVGIIGGIVSPEWAKTIGRLIGAAILGFAVGLMVALVEVFVREAWLVLHWGPKEETTVNLGATPVVLGTGSRAQIRLPGGLGIPAEWATIGLEQGKIELRDKSSGKVTSLKDGSELRVGNLKIIVRAAGSPRP